MLIDVYRAGKRMEVELDCCLWASREIMRCARLTALRIRREVVVVLTKRLRSKGLSLGKLWRITLRVVRSRRRVEKSRISTAFYEDWPFMWKISKVLGRFWCEEATD